MMRCLFTWEFSFLNEEAAITSASMPELKNVRMASVGGYEYHSIARRSDYAHTYRCHSNVLQFGMDALVIGSFSLRNENSQVNKHRIIALLGRRDSPTDAVERVLPVSREKRCTQKTTI